MAHGPAQLLLAQLLLTQLLLALLLVAGSQGAVSSYHKIKPHHPTAPPTLPPTKPHHPHHLEGGHPKIKPHHLTAPPTLPPTKPYHPHHLEGGQPKAAGKAAIPGSKSSGSIAVDHAKSGYGAGASKSAVGVLSAAAVSPGISAAAAKAPAYKAPVYKAPGYKVPVYKAVKHPTGPADVKFVRTKCTSVKKRRCCLLGSLGRHSCSCLRVGKQCFDVYLKPKQRLPTIKFFHIIYPPCPKCHSECKRGAVIICCHLWPKCK